MVITLAGPGNHVLPDSESEVESLGRADTGPHTLSRPSEGDCKEGTSILVQHCIYSASRLSYTQTHRPTNASQNRLSLQCACPHCVNKGNSMPTTVTTVSSIPPPVSLPCPPPPP